MNKERVWFVAHNSMFWCSEFRHFVESNEWESSSDEFGEKYPNKEKAVLRGVELFEIEMHERLWVLLTTPCVMDWLGETKSCHASIWPEWTEGIHFGDVPLKLDRANNDMLTFGCINVCSDSLKILSQPAECADLLIGVYAELICMRTLRRLRETTFGSLKKLMTGQSRRLAGDLLQSTKWPYSRVNW